MRSPTNIDYQAQAGLPQKKDLDELASKMLSATTEKDRENYTHQVLRILHDEAVYIPVWAISIVEVHKKDTLDGVEFDSDRYHVPFEKMKKLK
jgi:nickel transport system substrate-binding protein